jgi:hypothetical protein
MHILFATLKNIYKKLWRTVTVVLIVKKIPVMCCVLIWEQIVSKIREENVRKKFSSYIVVEFSELCNKDKQFYCVSIK